MKYLMIWLHGVLCILGTVVLLVLISTPCVTKDQFIGALFVYIYMILLLIGLIKED